jgi:hypothetical protein
MAMSISPSQSVLWDQIQYSGEPEDFAWVLPVKPGARIEVAQAAFFEVLDALTATRVVPPNIDCFDSQPGFGCGSYAMEGLDARSTDDTSAPVDVVHHGTVGPYETVTLSTETPGALNTWLEENGYNVDESTQPVVDQYVAEGFDFIALRLQPGQGVSQMAPVRVVMSGSNVTLPLRMVAIGTGAQTPIVLYVIGEGRYSTQNFPEVAFDEAKLGWNFAKEESNYAALRIDTLAQNEGRSWLATFALNGLLTGPAGDEATGPMLFPERYATQAFKNKDSAELCAVSMELGQFSATGVVKNPCPPGEAWDSEACVALGPDEIDARMFGCEGVDDVAVALEGLHPYDTWVTRLEANLPREALGEDLVLKGTTAEPVYTTRQAQFPFDPQNACASANEGELGVRALQLGRGNPKGGLPFGGLVGVSLAALAVAYAARRKRVRA